MRLYTRLKFWRIQNGWTQEELAERAGCSKSTISKIERTGMLPHADVIARLANGLGLSTKQLFTLDPDQADGKQQTAQAVA